MVKQYEIYWIALDPTLGSEINKIRPCLVVSPNDSNAYLNTVIIAPVTSTIKKYPMRMDIILQGKDGQIALDKLRCVDKVRIKDKMGTLDKKEIETIKNLIKEYLVK